MKINRETSIPWPKQTFCKRKKGRKKLDAFLKLVSIRARYAQFLTKLSVVRAAIHFFCNPFLSFFLFLIQEY